MYKKVTQYFLISFLILLSFPMSPMFRTHGLLAKIIQMAPCRTSKVVVPVGSQRSKDEIKGIEIQRNLAEIKKQMDDDMKKIWKKSQPLKK